MTEALSNLTKIFGVADLTNKGHHGFIHTLHMMHVQQERFEMDPAAIEAVKEKAVEAFGIGGAELGSVMKEDSEMIIRGADGFDHTVGYAFREENS